MKTQTLFLPALILILFTVQVNAQLQVGGVLFVNLSSISVDPEPSDEEYKSRVGIGIGGVLDAPITENLSFRTEPMFLQKGGKVEEDGDDATFNIAYFEIPLMLKYAFEAGEIMPYVLAGPSIGLLTTAKAEFDGFENDIKDETAGTDFSVTFGGGITIPMSTMNFFGEIRYDLGFTNVNEDEGSNESEVKNRGLKIGVGITVPIGG